MSKRTISYSEAICEGIHQSMVSDERVIIIGEGVPDPKRIFNTTEGLLETFGAERVFDMPLSENGLTGICIGAAQAGLRPIMVHQRVDFMLLAMDQLINSAAKWRYLFGEGAEVPVVFRAIIGRGWGQGPQHSQSLQALFAHIPGLRVVMPATGYDAKGMLISAIKDNNPVVFLEHRWLHHTLDHVPEGYYSASIEGARVVKQGDSITIVAFSYMVVEAVRASEWLSLQGIDVELIDIRSVRPLDLATIINSVNKTGRLLVLDTAWKTCGVSAEIIASVSELAFDALTSPPMRIALPDRSTPTSPSLTDSFYPEAEQVAEGVLKMLGVSQSEIIKSVHNLCRQGSRDTPNSSFRGPF